MALIQNQNYIPDYSQGGEARILHGLLNCFPVLSRECIEFGAGDGIVFSNTRHLSECFDYRATLIESDAKLFQLLKKNALPGSRIIETQVGWRAEDNLDGLEVCEDPDVCSIDVDGVDYHIWSAMSKTRPKLVCIEINPTIPNDVEFVQAKDAAVHHGSSLRSLSALGKEKGYQLAAVTTFNALFVRADLFGFTGITDNRLDTLRPAAPLATYVFTGYDGQVFLSGPKRIPWHPVHFRETKMQILPKMFRAYRRTPIKEHAFKVWLKARSLWA